MNHPQRIVGPSDLASALAVPQNVHSDKLGGGAFVRPIPRIDVQPEPLFCSPALC